MYMISLKSSRLLGTQIRRAVVFGAIVQSMNVGNSSVVPSHRAMCSKRKIVICQKLKVMNKELFIGTLQCIFFALVCYFIILIFH